MNIKMARDTWIKEHDKPVLEILQKVDKMPTIDELVEMTGLPRSSVEETLRMVNIQRRREVSRRLWADFLG